MDTIPGQMQETKMMAIPLYNLGCGGGRARLAETVVARTPGVLAVYANPATEALYVKYDPARISRAHLVEEIERLGLGRPDNGARHE